MEISQGVDDDSQLASDHNESVMNKGSCYQMSKPVYEDTVNVAKGNAELTAYFMRVMNALKIQGNWKGRVDGGTIKEREKKVWYVQKRNNKTTEGQEEYTMPFALTDKQKKQEEREQQGKKMDCQKGNEKHCSKK